MRDRLRCDGKESGFALIMAIMALLLLTFLGLTLAASTTTELQIATNYRWSEQAYYNAEAGLEVAKAYLKVLNVDTVVPDVRPFWTVSSTPPLATPFPQLPTPRANPVTRRDAFGNPIRNFAPTELPQDPTNPAQNCDFFGDGAGYGVVFDDGVTPGLPLQNVTQIVLPGGVVVGDLDGDGRLDTLRGAFTVWVRRKLVYGVAGNDTAQDDPDATALILTAEGVAPAEGGQFGGGLGNRQFYANRATRVLEAEVRVGPPQGNVCNDTLSQASETGLRCMP